MDLNNWASDYDRVGTLQVISCCVVLCCIEHCSILYYVLNVKIGGPQDMWASDCCLVGTLPVTFMMCYDILYYIILYYIILYYIKLYYTVSFFIFIMLPGPPVLRYDWVGACHSTSPDILSLFVPSRCTIVRCFVVDCVRLYILYTHAIRRALPTLRSGRVSTAG